MTEKGKDLPICNCHVTMIKKDAYIGSAMQLQNHSSTFIHNKSLLSATSILYRSPMACNATAPLEKLTCTNYVHFVKCHDRFAHFSWSKYVSKYLDVKLNVFKRGDDKEFRVVQNLTMGEADFKQFMRLRIKLVMAAKNCAREETLTLVLMPTMSRDTD